MKNFAILSLILMILTSACEKKAEPVIDLSGEWQFRMDPDDTGEQQKWYDQDLGEQVRLPGSMAENGKGYDITMETRWTGGIQNPEWFSHPAYAPYHDPENIRFPFWLQPVKKYTGAAWYRKTVVIPENWTGKQVFLHLERPHWESVLWINGTLAGKRNSLATPHVFNITSWIKPGENVVAIRVDNRTKDVDVGENSHSISDHTQSNWNGIAGKITLRASGEAYFKRVDVFPDLQQKSAGIEAMVINTLDEEIEVKIPVFTRLKGNNKTQGKKVFPFTLSPGENLLKMNYTSGEDVLPWDEFQPNVYELVISLPSDNGVDQRVIDFGYRDFKVEGTRFAINGRPVFLRGTLECAIFPLTGYPPTGMPGWVKVFTAVKDHGLNHVRFHSWCPPEAAFKAADSMGVYLQVECSSWANQSSRLGSGLPIDQYILDESERIVETYGNHPSFVMMAYGNEPGGPAYREFLSRFVSDWREKDSRRIYTSAAGWPELPVNQYHNIPKPRIQGWGQGLNSIINAEPPRTDYDWTDKLSGDGIPVVSHEIGQWCVFPNLKETAKYTGVLKARNFEIFAESLEAHKMEHLADSFLLASGKLQALCYKADIEAALRTPGFAGFQLLDLHDFPGQGTALVGVLDPFWEEKGYITPEEYRRFCNSTVPLARLEKRIFNEGDTLTAEIEVAHFGEKPLMNVNPEWKLIENGEIAAEGSFGQRQVGWNNAIPLGTVAYPFPEKNKPRKMTLEVTVDRFSNSWDIWVYPAENEQATEEIRVVEKIDNATAGFLSKGGKVLLSLGQGKVSPEMGGDVGVGFSSIFWNTAWTHNQKPHTLGILCDPAHPALSEFPTEYYSDWQWWDAMRHADAVRLDSLPAELKPIVRIIDDWVTNRRLALLFEAKVGEGGILVSGTDLVNNLENRPEARQLLHSLKKYMAGPQFAPGVDLEISEVKNILK